MIAFLIASAAAGLSIQPSIDPPVIRPAWSTYELQWMKPIDWTCNISSVGSSDFTIEGRFGSPVIPTDSNRRFLRPVTLRSTEPFQLSGEGQASMGSASTLAGWHQFEIVMPAITYKFEMDYIEAEVPGYMKILSSTRRSGGGAPIWQLEGIGLCSTTASTVGNAE